MDVEDKPPWTTHRDVGSFPKRREREGMSSRRVSELISDSISLKTKYLSKKSIRVTTKENILSNEYMYCYLGI